MAHINHMEVNTPHPPEPTAPQPEPMEQQLDHIQALPLAIQAATPLAKPHTHHTPELLVH
jgi:hypothetical protein